MRESEGLSGSELLSQILFYAHPTRVKRWKTGKKNVAVLHEVPSQILCYADSEGTLQTPMSSSCALHSDDGSSRAARAKRSN